MSATPIVIRFEEISPVELAPGVRLRPLVGRGTKATAIFTGVVEIEPGAQLPYHTHPCDEAITALAGSPAVEVEGRRYRLGRLDTALAPTGAAHTVMNPGSELASVHVSFAADFPARTIIETPFKVVDMTGNEDSLAAPETLWRAPASRLDGGFDLFNGQGFRGVYVILDANTTSAPAAVDGDVSIAVVAGALRIQIGDLQNDLSLHDGFYLPPAQSASLFAAEGPAAVIRVEAVAT